MQPQRTPRNRKQSTERDRARDRELVDRVLSGDPLAFSQIYDDYFTRVYAFVLKRVGDPAEAEDLAQEAVLRGAQKRGDGVILGSPRGWLLVVARNLGRDLRRRRERIGVESLDALAHEPCVAEVPEGGQDGLGLGDLHDAFLQLAPRDRLALTSWTVHEGAAARVAEDLGVRRELVKVRLFRARQRLRRALETLGAGA